MCKKHTWYFGKEKYTGYLISETYHYYFVKTSDNKIKKIPKNVKDNNVEYVLYKYKSILKKLSINGREMADLMRMNYISYRKATMPSAKTVPNWVKTFMKAHDLCNINEHSTG